MATAYKLGIAFSGGGVRGMAHAGVLAALAEQGLEPDCISGTSSGALVGAFYAAGHSPEVVLEFFRDRSPFRLSNLSLVKAGFIDTDNIRDDLAAYFPDDTFEALDKPLFITATDILAGRPVVFSSGPLISAILASASLPLIFSPVDIENRLYADGGIVNNFPVEHLHEVCDVVIGSYASPLRHIRRADLASRLAVSQRALGIGVFFASQAKFHTCDVLLCPPELAGFNGLDNRHLDEIYEIGYRAAKEQIGALHAAIAARGE